MNKKDLIKTKQFCMAPWTHMHFMPNSTSKIRLLTRQRPLKKTVFYCIWNATADRAWLAACWLHAQFWAEPVFEYDITNYD